MSLISETHSISVIVYHHQIVALLLSAASMRPRIIGTAAAARMPAMRITITISISAKPFLGFICLDFLQEEFYNRISYALTQSAKSISDLSNCSQKLQPRNL